MAQRRSRSLSCSASSSSNGTESTAVPALRRRPKYVPGKIDDPNYVRIFDTTLRDGEQSPGATLTSKEKMEIAKQLAKLGVDIIEAGFPAASPDDFEAVRSIALEVGNAIDANGYVPVICGLSRCVVKDMDAAWDAVRLARLPRVHIFIATSQIHMEYKLKMTPDQVVENAVNAVKYLKSRGCEDIEFSPEDAGRSEPAFLYRILEAVIKAGATTLNIPDTVGWCMPHEFGQIIAGIIANTPGAGDVVVSTHCQNDLGLATANSLAGAYAGARQCECTVNGIGERAGNASLEEVVMSIDKRGELALGGLWTGVRPQQITIASKMVKDFTGVMLQPHKAIVGSNAYAHESGIHQDGMLKNKLTYEIIAPEEIGHQRADPAGLVLGKHSGRNALKNRLGFLGFELPQDRLDDIFKRFKAVADSKKTVADEDILALLGDEANQEDRLWDLLDLQVVCGTMGLPTATVRMRGPDGISRTATGLGSGPFDAACKAIDTLVRVQAALEHYSVNAVTTGPEALATTRVTLKPRGRIADQGYITSAQGNTHQRTFSGNGADDDIVVSSVRAYVSAMNKLIAFVSKNERRAAEAASQSALQGLEEPEPKLVTTR